MSLVQILKFGDYVYETETSYWYLFLKKCHKQWLAITYSTLVTAMLLVVLQAVKIRIRFGVLLLNVQQHYLRINRDMLWYEGSYFHFYPFIYFT